MYQGVPHPQHKRSSQCSEVSLFPILFSGDQLTVARGRGAKRAKVNLPSPISRFDGLVPVCEDWHTKVVLLEVYITKIIVMFSYIFWLCHSGDLEVFLFYGFGRTAWHTLPIEKQT